MTRFVLESVAGNPDIMQAELMEYDRDIINEMKSVEEDTTQNLETYKIHLSIENLYHFIWHRFADDIIEESKPILRGEDAAAKASRQRLLYELLISSLKQLHPFMPFVTEAIWQSLPHKESEMLMVASWPR